MCVKIISYKKEQEFNPSEPLEDQMIGAEEVVINYDPVDSRINSFVTEVERLCKNGISCNFEIKFNANNSLSGLKLGRRLEKAKRKLDVNEVVKGLAKFHLDTDRKLSELYNMCLGDVNEQ